MIKLSEKSKPIYSVLLGISVAHLLNDLIQGLIASVYPLLKQTHQLTFAQIGMITLMYQLAASIFQPLVGAYTDKRPMPYSQMISMSFLMVGVVLFSYASSYGALILAVVVIGIGSSIFHPESSRVASFAAKDHRSLAQSIFQIGGNLGTALSPLLVAYIVLPYGQIHLLWFLSFLLIGQLVSYYIGNSYSKQLKANSSHASRKIVLPNLTETQVYKSVGILMMLIVSKYFYIASITNYFQFFTMKKFGITDVAAQHYLFYFLLAVAVGTLIGGVFGDRLGRKYIIWFSVLGAAPFAMALPYANLLWTGILIVIIGFIIASAFPSIIVYAQELLPKKLGMISGLFYGFAFGMGGLGSAILGWQADKTSIEHIYLLCSFLPLIGILAYWLPNLQKATVLKDVDIAK